jgi:hypothetical protein
MDFRRLELAFGINIATKGSGIAGCHLIFGW